MKKNIHEIIDKLAQMIMTVEDEILRQDMSENFKNVIQDVNEIIDDYYESEMWKERLKKIV